MSKKMMFGWIVVVALHSLARAGRGAGQREHQPPAPPAFQVVPGTPVEYAPRYPQLLQYGGRYYEVQ